MGANAKDEKLLMHFFQESHTGAAITWYTNLEPFQVFLEGQYQYNFDMAPDRMQLQSMCKRRHRSFKEYAPKVEGPGNSSSTSHDGERDDHIDRGHITSVLLWESGGLNTFKLCGFGLHWRKDQSGSKKRQICLSCFDERENWGKWREWDRGRNPCCYYRSYMAKFPITSTTSLLSQYQPFSLPPT